MFQHSGGISTFISRLVLMPDAQVGIFLAINGPSPSEHTTRLMQALLMHIMDHALGLPPWLNSSTLCTFPEPWISAPISDPPSPAEHEAEVAEAEVFGDVTLDIYAGRYSHPGFGDMDVYVNDTDLHLHVRYGRYGEAKLFGLERPGAFKWLWQGVLWYNNANSWFTAIFSNKSSLGVTESMVIPEEGMEFRRDFHPTNDVPGEYYCEDAKHSTCGCNMIHNSSRKLLVINTLAIMIFAIVYICE